MCGKNVGFNKIESWYEIHTVNIQGSSSKTFLTVACSVFTYSNVAHSFMIFLKNETLFVVYFFK